MSADLIYYTNPMSRGRIGRWMLEEVGAPYEVQVLEYDGMKAPAYLAINPMGKVPALRHGDVVVTETAAICAYLADAYPAAGLAPAPGSAARGAYFRWLFYAAGPIEAAITNKSLGVEVPPGKQRMAGYGDFTTVMDVLNGVLAGDGYLAGDAFSAADLYLGSQIGFGLAFGTITDRPVLQAYWSRISGRPAAIRARELDDAVLPEEYRGRF